MEFTTNVSAFIPDLDQNLTAIHGSEFEHRFFRNSISLNRSGSPGKQTATVCIADLIDVVIIAYEFVLTRRQRNASDSELKGNVGSDSLSGFGMSRDDKKQNSE